MESDITKVEISQRYRCKSCNHEFIINHGFERNRATLKAITVELDLYFKEVSLRKVCEHLKQFYDPRISHVAIIDMIRKFVDIVKPFVNSMSPSIFHIISNSN
jgi:transposase-like protein